MKEITVREWISRFQRGDFNSKDVKTQIDAGWYDWFCDDSKLVKKTKEIGALLARITNPFILDNFRVWFKINCAVVGRLYEDFRFEPLDESKRDQMYFGVRIRDRRYQTDFCLFTAESGYEDVAFTDYKDELIGFIDQLGRDYVDETMVS